MLIGDYSVNLSARTFFTIPYIIVYSKWSSSYTTDIVYKSKFI